MFYDVIRRLLIEAVKYLGAAAVWSMVTKLTGKTVSNVDEASTVLIEWAAGDRGKLMSIMSAFGKENGGKGMEAVNAAIDATTHLMDDDMKEQLADYQTFMAKRLGRETGDGKISKFGTISMSDTKEVLAVQIAQFTLVEKICAILGVTPVQAKDLVSAIHTVELDSFDMYILLRR